ncbi:YoaK family protein [Phycicoccus sp. Root101]|uniref:YoaK family protein n=1 Tax=Phycicoccus sp. Root101 TaxID=1736421 RepID=UPI000A707418|nr:YoaK family protein [Phycicoccus sp. Root101]
MEPLPHVRPSQARSSLARRARAHLVGAADAARSEQANRHLANLLALIAGTLNSVGFVAVSVYTSHMTGLTASVADHLVLGAYSVVGVGLLAIGSFVLGAMACAVLFNWGRRRGLRGRYANVLVVEALLVLVFGGAADLLVWRHRTMVFVAVLCFTMGLQNAIITKISQAQIRTTHVTGMVTDIGIELGKLVYRSRRAGLEPVRADLSKLSMLSVLVGLFFVGGLVGAAGYLAIGFPVLLVPAVVLLAVALPPVLADLRRIRS